MKNNMKIVSFLDKIMLRYGKLPSSIRNQRIPLQKIDVIAQYDYRFELKNSDEMLAALITYGNAICAIKHRIMPKCIMVQTADFIDYMDVVDDCLYPHFNELQWYHVIEKLALNGFNFTYITKGDNNYPIFLNPSTCEVFDFRCFVNQDYYKLSISNPMEIDRFPERKLWGHLISSYTKPFDVSYRICASREIIHIYWMQFLTDDAKSCALQLKTELEKYKLPIL